MNSQILLTDEKHGLSEPALHREMQLAPTRTDEPYAMAAKLIRVSAGDFRFEVHDLHFQRGRHTAIIGPNGAGKTTLIEALLGFRQAHLEEAQILGVAAARFLQSTRHRKRLGVQLQRVEYEDSSNVREILDLHQALYGKQDPQVAQALDIEALRQLPYRALSRGQKQRLDLFVALAHHPELVVLDEPFTGLDRAYIERVAHLLRYDLADLTIIMICHSVEELDTASDVVWVCNGGVEYRGDKESLKNRLVGAFHACLQLDDSDHLKAIYHQLERESATLRLSMPSNNEISVYGTQELDQSIRRLIGNVAFQHFEFGPTHYRDMLHLCAQGEQDA